MCYINNGDNMRKILDRIKIKKGTIRKQPLKKFSSNEVVFLMVVTCIVSLIFGTFINNKEPQTNNDKTLQEFIDTYNDIVENYYGDIDKEELLSGAINGMLSTLDQYSTLIDTNTNENFYLTLEGSYSGIGVEISNDANNNIVIIGILEDSPAQKAGLKVGDVVKKIDDLDLTGKEFSTLSNYVRKNSKKSEYKVIVDRNGEEKTFELKKETVTIKSVSSKVIEKDNHKIGYIYISIFSNTTSAQFKSALDELKKQGVEALIFDVRENTGGHLTTVTSMLSNLLSKENIIYQVEKNDKRSKFYSLGNKNIDCPIIIVQNGNSASASELFSIALKEDANAIVVGEKSYGKGTIQELNYLSNGDSYKYTTKKWLSPKGNWINKKGVVPDVEVKLDENYSNNPNDENDNQLQTAINEAIKKITNR